MTTNNGKEVFNRGTGLLVIEARYSNPNGDPDTESDPRTLDGDGRGIISPVSFKRKLRDLIEDPNSLAMQSAQETIGLDDINHYKILEHRGRNRQEISRMPAEQFKATYWDARVFGNTFLESLENAGDQNDRSHFISTGTVQFGMGVSVTPVEIERLTMTSKAGVEEGKDRGMAPLGYRVVKHGLYYMPYFVNPMMARKSGCNAKDIELLKFLIPLAYRNTASASRPHIEIIHAWYVEHKTPLGSCPDAKILDALIPKKENGAPDEPSNSLNDYNVPEKLPEEIVERIKDFEDLITKIW